MKTMVFLADIFAEDYVGGAELTTEAIINGSDERTSISKIRCAELNKDTINNFKDKHWIIFNFSQLSSDLKLHLIKNVDYSIVEYDYKFCDFRSIELHKIKTSKPCDCIKKVENKINLAFYGYAKKIWFMSNKQKSIFLENVRTIKEENTQTLNSAFSDGDIRFINSIKDNEKDENFLIVKSDSWVKGYENCVKYAQDNKLKYEVVSSLPYHELLIKLSTSKGLIFLPDGADTCPRLVMEAQVLGCDLIINERVQHKDEPWFSDKESCLEHMRSRVPTFWSYYE